MFNLTNGDFLPHRLRGNVGIASFMIQEPFIRCRRRSTSFATAELCSVLLTFRFATCNCQAEKPVNECFRPLFIGVGGWFHLPPISKYYTLGRNRPRLYRWLKSGGQISQKMLQNSIFRSNFHILIIFLIFSRNSTFWSDSQILVATHLFLVNVTLLKYFFVLLGSKLTDLHIEKFNSVFAAFRSEFT